MKNILLPAALAAALIAPPANAADVNVDAYVKRDRFGDIKISPSGDHYAATVPLGDRTALAILRRSDNQLTATFQIGKNSHVSGFWWVNDERVVISMSEKIGSHDAPRPTGDLYAINADGSRPDILVGQSVVSAGPGSKIQPKKAEHVAAFLVDDLAHDDKNVIVSISPFTDDPYTRLERLDVYSGRRVQVARAPVRNAQFVTDHKGVVRFAYGYDTDRNERLYYRSAEGSEWRLLGSELSRGGKEWPIGFSADDSVAYFETEQPTGPNAIIAFDIASEKRRELMRDDTVDPAGFIYRNGSMTPVGAFFVDGTLRTAFFDTGSTEARLYRLLENSFGGDAVRITSQTDDGALALVHVSSDRNPGDYFVFDTVGKKAAHLLSRRDWFDPEAMARMQPVSLKARDGVALHGYVTTPNGSSGKNLPLVVMPHGGPYGEQDVWGFDSDVQMLAEAGYAVLQLNFRGSGGFGRSFVQSGAAQWGGAMQDDLTDATRWAVEQGIADASRICIYGASYGGYASLMGVAKEPGLYRCAVGYIGVYDLPTMHTQGDIQRRGSGETYLREWIGEPASLGSVSPNRIADRIKAPVFLAAGGEDERAPIAHSRMMEQALRKAGVPVETLYYETEGHGFYKDEHRREYYTRLLAFLSRHLGGGVAKAGGAVPVTAGK